MIGGGRAGGRKGNVADVLGLWLYTHRRRIRVGVAAAVAVLLVGAGFVGVRYLRGPALPRLVAARSNAPQDASPNARWDTGPDGRPRSVVTIEVQAQITLSGLPTGRGTRVDLLGLTGPGVVPFEASSFRSDPVQAAGEGLVTEVAWDLEVACDTVPLPVPAGGYGVQVRVTDGGRRSSGVLPAGDLDTWFAKAVQTACGSWLAKRDLSVDTVTVTERPGVPGATLAISVTNRGPVPAQLTAFSAPGLTAMFGPRSQSGEGRLTTTVAARSTTTVNLTVDVDDCGSVDLMADVTSRAPSTMEALGLAAIVGTWKPSEAMAFGDGSGPTGIVVSTAASAQIDALKTRLCAGIRGVEAHVDGPKARWDATRRVLTIPLQVHLKMRIPHARAVGGTVNGGPGGSGSGDDISLLTPLGTRFAADRSGTGVTLTLAYRLPRAVSCSADHLPELPGPSLSLEVRTPTGPRTVPVELSLAWTGPPAGLANLCP